MQPDDSDVEFTNTAARPSATPERGLPTVDGYRLVRRLGQGGMAVVYLAVQESLDREVAIKVIAAAASEDEAQAARFEHEARVIAKLEHPGIVGIHEVGRTAEGQLYYVMPYLARGDLSQRDYRDSEARIIELLRGLLDALGYAHARGIVHRDVKAENVLFNNADRPQLTDFGIALSRRVGNARVTTDGLALGSGGYMSPEQARGEQVDGRADLYSLGVLTFELLSGELPYRAEADDPLALALMHATDPVPLLPADKAHWQRFVGEAMAKSPDRRFRNAQAMLRALEPLARRLHPPAGLRAFFAHAFWRQPYGLVAAGALLVFLALLVGMLFMPLLRGDSASSSSVVAPDDTTMVIPDAAVAPTADEVQAGIALRLQQAKAQLDAGNTIAPAGANAAESYLAVLRIEPANADAANGLDEVLAALGRNVVTAVNKRQRDVARERYEEARLLSESMKLETRPAWPAMQGEVRKAITQRVESALAAFDRTTAVAWASLPVELGLDNEIMRALHARATALPEAGSTSRDDGGPDLALIPAELGRSQMLHSFALMRSEVTRGEYASFVAQTKRAATRCRNRLSPLQFLDKRQWNDPGFEQGGNHPVVCVSFDDARAYAAWLSRRTGQRYRLPTLQEWRHAAQFVPSGVICADGNVSDRSAGRGESFHACNDKQRYTASARSYRANRVNLHDLVGNASEWTLACGEAGNPVARLLEKEACPRRAAAGLSWRDGRDAAPASHRQMLEPDRGYDDVGFRLLKEL